MLDRMTTSDRRPTLRSVAMPAEHGGWGLTLEPGILGVLLAPSLAGRSKSFALTLTGISRWMFCLVAVAPSTPQAPTRS